MTDLFYSTRAKQDLLEIGGYLAEKNPAAAERVVELIYNACERLREFPLSGASRDDIRPHLRYTVVAHYLILYQFQQEAVHIIRIVHGARFLPELI